MIDQQNLEAPRPASADSVVTVTPVHPGSVESLAKELGLKLGDQNGLTIRRIKRGKSYSFVRANGSPIRHTGTRGATTLLKSNVTLEDDSLVLSFKAKGGKAVRKECDAAKLVRAIGILRGLPGKRMFQYRDNSGNVRAVSTTQVNAFLREIAGIKISLKDFRTLMASAVVLESLSRMSPAASARGRRKQVLEAVRAAADELSNTPAICRKSYVHDTIVTAFEDGILERFAATMKGYRSQSKREQLLAQVVTAAAA